MFDLEKNLIENKPVNCDKCDGKIYYVGNGKYYCNSCEKSISDQLFLNLEMNIPDNSKYFLKCSKCGCSIRDGRYCTTCVRDIAGSIQGLIREDMGRRSAELFGKMHYQGRK